MNKYKNFKGFMKIKPINSKKTFEICGEWKYKKDFQCWYCNGESFPEEICEIGKVLCYV